MAKEPSPPPPTWGVFGIMAVCFFGLLCFYHAVFWFWQTVAFGLDKEQAWTHITIWLVLGVAAAVVWCRLLWILYFPKKKL